MRELITMIENKLSILTGSYPEFGGITLAVIAAGIIMLLARKKTPRDFSFKIRSSLNDIEGYSKLFYDGKLGPVTLDQKKYLSEILAGTSIIANEIKKIESMKINQPDTKIAFDLRTALMGINGYRDLLLQSQPEINSKQKECLNEIQRAAKYILQLMPN